MDTLYFCRLNHPIKKCFMNFNDYKNCISTFLNNSYSIEEIMKLTIEDIEIITKFLDLKTGKTSLYIGTSPAIDDTGDPTKPYLAFNVDNETYVFNRNNFNSFKGTAYETDSFDACDY
jgi:hypothetical protein